MRVRDLSAELGISNKELIHHLRELNIQVKSHMSGLTEPEIRKVREKYAQESGKTGVVNKKASSGVIVRKRHREQPPQEAAEDKAVEGEPVEAPVEAAAPEAEPAVEEKPAGARIVVPAAATDTPEQKVAPSVEEPSAAEEPAAEEPAAEEPAAEEVVPEASEKSEPQEESAPVAGSESEKEEAAPVGKPAAEEPEKAGAAEGGTDEDKPRKKKGKKRKAPQPVQVRIISVPDTPPEPAKPKTQPRKPVDRGPARPRPAAAAPGAPGAPAAPGGAAPAPSAGAKDGKKRKGKRRVVEGADLYRREADVDRVLGRGRKGDKRGKGRKGGRPEPRPVSQPLKAAKRKIKVDEAIRLSDLAHQMGVKAQELIKTLFGMGVMATINQSIDLDTAELIAAEYNYEVEKVGFSEDTFILPKEVDKPEDLRPRPPVVTIMGHVDHGKTSLLDAIRKSNITSGEAGGITQHIGAYHVKTRRGEIVFLDTPGHEAFTTMRARGAQVTDLVILVVAADDGVMEQTREALNHSKAAGVPIVVAVNKMDKEGANPDRVKRELAEFDLVPEDWGGDTIFANVSAKAGTGLDELLEMVQLQAEVLELKANPDKSGRGHIVEARLDKGRGPVATVLIQEGSISQGDAFVCGLFSGKVRAMFNDQGKKIKTAGPAMPAEIQGFEGVPEAGDEFVIVSDEKVARRIAETRQVKQREKDLAKESKVTLESFLASSPDEEVKTLNLVLKADVQGSLEAIGEALQKLSTDEVKINIIHGGAGAITESDILLASASSAIIIGFNIRPTAKIKDVAEAEKVDIRFYNIIYKLVSEIKDAMSGMLSPEIREVYLGQAEVRQTFSVPKAGTIAGCVVVDGKLQRNAGIRLLRDGVVLYTGSLNSLKRFKDDAKEVAKGYECGVGLERFNDIKEGDVIEAFTEVEEQRTL
jgi:translation initiation factor IF-2